MSVVIFAIHTVPDTETGTRKYNLGDLLEKDVIKAIMHLQQQSGKQELPAFMQRIVAISAIFPQENKEVAVETWGGEDETEQSILDCFFRMIDVNRCTKLVSWNNTNDQPVLMYRCLKNKVIAPILNRGSPISLKGLLSCNQLEAQTQQQNVMDMLAINHAPVLTIQQIWKYWRKGKHSAIQQSCIHQVLDSYKIYQRYQLVTGSS